ncbi:universal stress protein [Virgisporangium aliadipatigenens]|uniref:Universal stress protein n=1 Tax=Virgisporangium aliadipatigenens TaxID=741659 RepID=A0A8J4DTD3_9ACTN|nr:universal stress protein [Virgisporangium aliadipatigenens]GIJ48132.1 universal stress protein [Virgisporangium aliadipatigenens]
MTGLIVVGVDGSRHASRAVELAADAAARRGAELQVIHAFTWPLIHPPLVPDTSTEYLDPRRRAWVIVDAAECAAVQRHPELVLDGRVVNGAAPGVLVEASRHADVLYVGHRGLSGFNELVMGSVGVAAIIDAYCPVVVVRGEPSAPDAPVIVGIDGSNSAYVAARAGFEEARLRGADLVAAWVRTPGLGRRAAEWDADATALPGIAQGFPGVRWTTHLGYDQSAPEYLERLAKRTGAGLLVVGSHGIGGLRGLLLGGTCRHLVDHAPCPVLVTRPKVEQRTAVGKAATGTSPTA